MHPRQNVVARPVDDALERDDAIRSEGFSDHSQDRDAAGNRGLIVEVYALPFGELEQLVPVLRDQRFVGRHHMLAAFDGTADDLERRVDPPHHLDHNIDIRIADGRGRVESKLRLRNQVASTLAGAASNHAGHRDRGAEATFDGRCVVSQEAQNPLAHDANAQKRDLNSILAHGATLVP